MIPQAVGGRCGLIGCERVLLFCLVILHIIFLTLHLLLLPQLHRFGLVSSVVQEVIGHEHRWLALVVRWG